MDQLILKKYKSYGQYVNSSRSFPLNLDGLKPVERRVLLSAYLVARNKFVKCPRVDGTCLARFHPHSSSYGTIVQMVTQGFLEGQGQFGNNLGVDPSPAAAMRYTECKLKAQTYEMMFKYVSYVPWVESESKDDEEPLYLPTMYPACLMGKEFTQGIGFGFRTIIPTYKIEDLFKRLMWLMKLRKTKPTIIPISDCDITASTIELEQLLTTGKATIPMKGKIVPHARTCKIIVQSWPPGRKFESILNKKPIKKLLDNQDIGFIDSSNSAAGTSIVFSVLKQRNRDKIFQECLDQIRIATTASVTFEITVSDIDHETKVVSVDQMLLDTYNMYVDTNQHMLKHKIEETNEKINEFAALLKIREPLAKLMTLKKSRKYELSKKVEIISTESGVDQEVVKLLLTKYNIQKLLTMEADTTELHEKVKSFKNDLVNVNDFVLDQYRSLGK